MKLTWTDRTAALAAMMAAAALAWPAVLQAAETPTAAGRPVLVDDFERGLAWDVSAERAPKPKIRRVEDAADGYAALRVDFAAGEGAAFVGRAVDGRKWAAANCDRLVLWVKGDGSRRRLMIRLADVDERLFSAEVSLAASSWRRVELEFADFRADGDYKLQPAEVRELAVGFGAKVPDATVWLDEIYAAPARLARCWDLTIPCEGGWGHRNPDAFEIGTDGTVRPDKPIGQFIHGTRNHPDMRTPFVFRVGFPVPGRFEVHVCETSGWGGAGLIIAVDGQEKLARDFPSDSQRGEHKYDGWYGVDVPAGDHTVSLDNRGADWTRIDRIRLVNYKTWWVGQAKRGGAIEVHIAGPDGKPVEDAAVWAEIVGKRLPLSPVGDGLYRSRPLADALPLGKYWAVVEAQRGGERLFRYEGAVRVPGYRFLPERIAFRVDDHPEGLKFVVRNPAGLDVQEIDGVAQVDGAPAVIDRGPEAGQWIVRLPEMAAGFHRLLVKLRRPRLSVRQPLAVYRRLDGPPPEMETVRLGDDGWFRAGNRPFVCLGYATIHVFEPVAGWREIVGGWTGSAWCNAPEERIADWLAYLCAHGVNVVRFGLTVKWDGVNGDLGGHASERFMAALRRFADLAGSLGIRLLPVFYWGHWGTFGFDGVPAYVPLMKDWRSWFLEREALRLQKKFVQQVARAYASDPRIFAWEPMNEVIPGVDGDMRVPARWVREIATAVREVDREHLITESPNTRDSVVHTFFAQHCGADFINYHWYTDHRRPAESDTAGIVVHGRLNQLGGRPAIIGEAGWTGHYVGGRNYIDVTLATRDIYWLSLLAGCPAGVIGWDGATTAPEETAVVRRVFDEAGWWGRTRRKADVAVVFDDMRKSYGAMYRLQRQAFARGLSLDFVPREQAKGYRYIVDATVLGARLPQIYGPVVASAPYFAYSFQAADGRLVVAYVWNEAGFDGVGNRARKAGPLRLRVNVQRPMNLRLYDIDAMEVVAERQVEGRAELFVPLTEHDYVVVMTAGGE